MLRNMGSPKTMNFVFSFLMICFTFTSASCDSREINSADTPNLATAPQSKLVDEQPEANPAFQEIPDHSDAPDVEEPVAIAEQPDSADVDLARFDVPDWLTEAAKLPIGASFTPPLSDYVSTKTLRALGYGPGLGGSWIREADLMQQESLVSSAMPQMPHIGTIAVISTFRPYVEVQYLYATLRSLFTELPPTAVINVLVGDANIDYVAPDILAREIGESMASRVNIIPPPPQTAQYFAAHSIDVFSKSTWNYARALRGHSGPGALFMCEDDIVVSPKSLDQLRPFLLKEVTDIFVLYNDRCRNAPPSWISGGSNLIIDGATIRKNNDFPTTQAIIYAAQTAQDIGNYLMVHAGRESYDYLIGRYLGPFETVIGYVYPSIVQHVGYQTTGLSAPGSLPKSRCYQQDLDE